ncbi:MAG: HlyD family secretion protein [Polyangiales bacterium]
MKLTKTELDRMKGLFDKGAATQAQLDTAQAAYDQAVASLETAKARLAASQASVSASAGGVQTAKGKLDAASAIDEQIALAKAAVDLATAKTSQVEASLKLAELDLSYTKIVAPSRGVVSRKSVEVGQMVDPSRPLLAIVPKDDVWIVANFKEDQIGEMKVGAKATVKIDAYPGRELTAHVDSLAGASGARFALLPPDNASGNFTKVVQRLPVLVRIDGQPGLELKPGMSAYVTVAVK